MRGPREHLNEKLLNNLINELTLTACPGAALSYSLLTASNASNC